PPTPSIWRGSGDPMTRSSRSSRATGSAGRSLARKYSPLDVPPRICMARIPSYRASPCIRLARPQDAGCFGPSRGPEVSRLCVEAAPRPRSESSPPSAALTRAPRVLRVADVVDLGQLRAQPVHVEAEYPVGELLAVGVLLGDPGGRRAHRLRDVEP